MGGVPIVASLRRCGRFLVRSLCLLQVPQGDGDGVVPQFGVGVAHRPVCPCLCLRHAVLVFGGGVRFHVCTLPHALALGRILGSGLPMFHVKHSGDWGRV